MVTTVVIGGVVNSIAIQSDGKIIAAGGATQLFSGGDFALARYNKNGSLDNSFNSGGLVFTDFGGTDNATGMIIQPDRKIVLAGFTTASGGDYDFAVARYHGDDAFTIASGDEQPPSENQVRNEAVSAIHIYPNPASDIMHIEGLNTSSSAIKITDEAGNILQRQNVLTTQHSINVSALKPGIYYLNVVKGDKKVESVKFVKQ